MNCVQRPGSTHIYAHRGASVTHPENTLAAFGEAVRLGVHGIELDVRATRDGVPVVSHDAGLIRAVGVNRLVTDLTFAELRDVASEVPRLDEVLSLVAGRSHLDIEIKERGVEEATLVVLRDLPRDRWAISSFDWGVLGDVRGQDAEAELWVLCLTASAAAMDAAARLGATTLAVEQHAVIPELVARVASTGRRVMAWTVNDNLRVAELGAWGVSAVCTDVPAEILAAV